MMDWRQFVKKPWFVPTSIAGALAIAVMVFGLKSLWIAVGLAVGSLVVWLFFRWRENRQAAQFRAGLNQNAGKAPSGVNDPNRRVVLDGLRQKFNDGFKRVLDEGRRKGVDFLYRHPWIMVVGEPGSGKTEAIRHSGIVSPRNQDELQGAGGTLNMDWWFTDRAVILDTAGKMVFEEAAGTANNEFKEFLRLLRKGRPLTPINGLLVTVSADTLVGGTDEQIRERSTKLAEKIAQIQSALEVRFPVYVVVTKCDKITGFREFFESLDEPARVNQILGWSNPDGLDVPFKADKIEEHLAEVIDTLALVRYGLLERASVPAEGGTRRTDEVDSLYAFPHSLRTLAPRLKMYLEPVFAAGEWSASAPLFVRGVYFSSALCQGAVLDQELAAALGVSVDKLGDEGKIFRRDRALFLRDLFVEKIMLERGLVTASHSTEGIVFRRRLIVWSTFAVVVLAGLGAFLWANTVLSKGVADELGLWRAVKENRSTTGFVPVITRAGTAGTWTYVGEKTLLVNDEPVSLEEFHRRLETSTRQAMRVPWMFRPATAFRSDLNQLRRKAQVAVITSDVVQPLVEAARDRISRDDAWTDEHTDVLSRLVQIETSLHSGTAMPPSTEGFLRPFWQFGLRSAKTSKDIESAFDRSFSLVHGVQPSWPPARLSAGPSLAENKPIAAGIGKLARSQETRMKDAVAGLDALRELRTALVGLRRIEEDLSAAGRSQDVMRLRAWSDAIRRYRTQRNTVDQLIAKATDRGVFRPNVTLMTDAIATMSGEFQAGFEGFRKAIMDRAAVVGAGAASSRDFPLPDEIAGQLRKLGEDAAKQVTGAFSERDLTEVRALDQRFLLRDGAGVPAYVARVTLLEKMLEASQRGSGLADLRLIGHLSEFQRMVEAAEAERLQPAPVGGSIPAPSPPPAPTVGAGMKLGSIVPPVLGSGAAPAQPAPPPPAVASAPAGPDPVTLAARELLMDLYEAELDGFLDDHVGFPLVLDRVDRPMKPEVLPSLREVLSKMRGDLTGFDAMSQSASGRAAQVRGRVDRVLRLIEPIAFVLVSPEGRFSRLTAVYPGPNDQRTAVMAVVGQESFNARFAGVLWRSLGLDVKRWRAGDMFDLGEFPMVSDELRLDFYLFPDDSTPDGAPLYLLKDWQAFQGMLKRPSRRKEDGREWQVVFTRKDSRSVDRLFAITLKFTQPLPAAGDWPTWSQLKERGPTRR